MEFPTGYVPSSDVDRKPSQILLLAKFWNFQFSREYPRRPANLYQREDQVAVVVRDRISILSFQRFVLERFVMKKLLCLAAVLCYSFAGCTATETATDKVGNAAAAAGDAAVDAAAAADDAAVAAGDAAAAATDASAAAGDAAVAAGDAATVAEEVKK